VLSFQIGLLWPGLAGRFGDVFGIPFAIDGIAFTIGSKDPTTSRPSRPYPAPTGSGGHAGE
jgi:hypothetical protein